MSVYSKMTAIADAIRGKTGGASPLTLDQMAEAIVGIQVGGGSGDGLAYDVGEFVLDADAKHLPVASGIPHALGETPDFVVVWTDDFADLSADKVASQTVTVGYVWIHGLGGIMQRVANNAYSEYGFYATYILDTGEYFGRINVPTSNAYMMTDAYAATNEKIGLPVSSSVPTYRAGVKYKYFVSKGWW